MRHTWSWPCAYLSMLLVTSALAADSPEYQQPIPSWSAVDLVLDLKDYEHLPYVRFTPAFEDYAKAYWADLVIAISPDGSATFLPDLRSNVTIELYFAGLEPFLAQRHSSADARSIGRSAFEDVVQAGKPGELKYASDKLNQIEQCLSAAGCDIDASAQEVNSLLQTGQLQRLLRSLVVTQLQSTSPPLYPANATVAQSGRYFLFDLSGRGMSDLQRLSLVDTVTERDQISGLRTYRFYSRLWDIANASLTEIGSRVCSELAQLSLLPSGSVLYSVTAIEVSDEIGTGGGHELRATAAQITVLPAHCDSYKR